MDHLAAQGARRVALVAGPGRDHYTRCSLAAHREWCAERGAVPYAVPLAPGDSEGRYLDALLSGPDAPDALYGIYNPCGRQALASAARLGIRVPEELLLVCASEDPAYEATLPPLSTVSLDPRRAADLAIAALVDLIEHPRQAPGTSVVPARLLVRASSVRVPAAVEEILDQGSSVI
ncbi:substrate-binding domain-containing protein [Streptomyces sp. 150FB]|uniref:substrate-binding domain-containing protein n=1 Tax=Streptomyces sp. 150FB TaxID=1576605 RepID=UPI00099B958E|nr:substrate-binding domain-containing protein [Streptomyces sp. 150FB]